jgi:tetratricopeptide (TPR) repeat protein
MTGDGYLLRMGKKEFSWWRTQIFKTESLWEYKGVLHEYPHTQKQNPVLIRLDGNYNVDARTLGARNVGITPVEKYSRDAELLEKALVDEPENSRYQFYLAQSYFDSQQFEKAILAYKKRAEMGGWQEEVYYSLYRIAVSRSLLQRPWSEIFASFMDAYNYRPIRSEPLVHISQMLRQVHGQSAAAFVFARQAAEMPFPQGEILFVPDIIYKFSALDELGATAHAAGRPELGYLACKKLLEEGRCPPSEVQRVQNNYNQYRLIMEQIGEQKRQHEEQQKKMIQPKVETKPAKYKSRKKVKT